MPLSRAVDPGLAAGDPVEGVAGGAVAIPDDVLSAGLGVALTAVLEAGPAADLAGESRPTSKPSSRSTRRSSRR